MIRIWNQKTVWKAATCALAFLAVQTVASAQGFYVGQSNGSIQVATSGGTTAYSSTGTNGNVGGMILDAGNNLYVVDSSGGNIFKYDTAGNRTTFASGLMNPGDIALDNVGNVYVASTGMGTILRYAPTGGAATTYASNLLAPQALTFGPTGILYVAENGDGNTNTGRITAIPVGGGTGTALATGLNQPVTLTLNPAATTAFVGLQGGSTVNGFSLADGAAVNTYSSLSFNQTSDITFDAAGNLYVAEYQSGTNTGTISRVTPGLVQTNFATLGANATGFVYAPNVPEPSVWAAVLAGMSLLGLMLRRTRQA